MWCLLALALLSADDEIARLHDALALEQSGNDAGALAALDREVRQDPVWALPRMEAARIRLKRGDDLDRAEMDLEVARALAPETPRVHFLLAQLAEERGKTQEAIDALERAVALRSDYYDAHERLAGLYFAKGDWADAQKHYAIVAKGLPDRTPDRLQLAAALERQGQTVDAEVTLKELLEEQPTSVLVARRLAEFYDRIHQPKLAARVRQRLDPDSKRKLRKLKKSSH